MEKEWIEWVSILFALVIILVSIGIPALVTIYQLVYFFGHCCKMDTKLKTVYHLHKLFELITIIAGFIELKIFLSIMEITNYNWYEQAINNQVHTPVATWTYPTVFVWFGVGLCGYFILRYVPVKKDRKSVV